VCSCRPARRSTSKFRGSCRRPADRLKGQGHAGPGGRAGDLLIAVSIAPHPLFAREGDDLRLELPITLYEAVLGGKVRVPTLDGAVELALPAGTNSGRTFRLKGKGFPGKSGSGDLLASVRIMLPEGGDADLEKLMNAWREGKAYDPRKAMGWISFCVFAGTPVDLVVGGSNTARGRVPVAGPKATTAEQAFYDPEV
jgi:DnaJ-class molecular chaperone